MKKTFQTLLMSIAASALLVACGGGSMSNADPKAVLQEFFERMAKKDLEGAAKLATKDSKAALDMMKKGMEMAEKFKDMPGAQSKEEDPSKDFANIEIGDAKIDGETALVPFKQKDKDVQFDFPLKKEGGAWKVDFSMATLMKMGMDQAQKQNMFEDNDNNNGDENNSGPNFNSDDVKKSMQMADSLMKTIDPKKMEEAMKALEKLKQ